MATLIKADGKTYDVFPLDEKEFKLKELQSYVGGNIQKLKLPNGLTLICNEDGMNLELPLNKKGSWCVQRAYEGAKTQNFFGNLLFLEKNEIVQ